MDIARKFGQDQKKIWYTNCWGKAMKTIITVIGKDKPGIIAGVSAALYALDINILDVSQTIMGEYFTMTMLVDLSRAALSFEEVKAALAKAGEPLEVAVRVQRLEIFDAMHRL